MLCRTSLEELVLGMEADRKLPVPSVYDAGEQVSEPDRGPLKSSYGAN
jgi:hypothetical protein